MQVRIKITSENRGLLAAYFQQDGVTAAADALRSGTSKAQFATVDSKRWRSMVEGYNAAMEAYNRRLTAIWDGEFDPEPDWV
jgi:hypothetical protein